MGIVTIYGNQLWASSPPGYAVRQLPTAPVPPGGEGCTDFNVASQDVEPEFEALWTLGDFGEEGTTIGAGDQIRWIDSVLNDPNGWPKANVRFRYVASDNAADQVDALFVTEAAVDSICGDPDIGDIWACTYEATFHVSLIIGNSHFGPGSTPNMTHASIVMHEAGHAFFGADHSGTGLMVSGPEAPYPDDAEIADLRNWLGI